jgi:hypothetical protein
LYIACDLELGQEESLVSHLDSLGYNMYWHQPELFNADNFAGNDLNVFGRITSRNLLCVDSRVSQELIGFTPVQNTRAA